ncbi:MAG: YiiX/YebB-like N1pC/P60 family cysteine hydrolase [Methylotenera sp.]|nr:YiiX/YebB-like N1pC/P60 family cysteine hydrolase [Methylotenera sp.]
MNNNLLCGGTPKLGTRLISLMLFVGTTAYASEINLNNGPEPAQPNNASAQTIEISAYYEQDALQVLSLIEQSQNLRKQLPIFVEESNQAIKKHKGALPSAYTLRLAKALSEAHDLRNSLFKQALLHRGALYRADDEMDDKARVTKIVIAMSATVTLFENNKAMRTAFDNESLLRKKLNEGYPEFDIPEGFYNSSITRSNNPEYRKMFGDAVSFFAGNKTEIELQIGQSSASIQSLYHHIAQSPMLPGFKGANVFKELVTLPVKAAGGAINLSGTSLNKIKFTSSKVVGNTIGMVRWRAGKLKDNAAVLEQILAQLQPGDILLEKTPFTLTDKSIPGHFGHAAIYVGSVEQLREMNALELPIVQKNLVKISEGHSVVEALRNGVQLNMLQAFMDVDDIAVLRPKNLTLADRLEAVKLALGNLGKKYDFNFDVNTTSTIVCSELVYIVYPQVDFVTKNVLGSFAITPDDIALRAGTEEADPLQLVLFGHDGKLIFGSSTDNKLEENGLALYDNLVKGKPLSGGIYTPNQRPIFTGFL